MPPAIYIKGNGPEALKHVQDEFERLVTVIFEELSADDVAQNGKKLSANYFKHLLDVEMVDKYVSAMSCSISNDTPKIGCELSRVSRTLTSYRWRSVSSSCTWMSW